MSTCFIISLWDMVARLVAGELRTELADAVRAEVNAAISSTNRQPQFDERIKMEGGNHQFVSAAQGNQ